MSRKTWVLLIAGFFGVLAGCSKGMDGTYQGFAISDLDNPGMSSQVSKANMPHIAVPLRLTVSGEKGAFESPGQAVSFPARVDGDRLILTDNRGGNQLVFVRREDGKTLDCQQCSQNGMPDMWVLLEK